MSWNKRNNCNNINGAIIKIIQTVFSTEQLGYLNYCIPNWHHCTYS